MDDSPFAPSSAFRGLPCSDIAERGVLCSILLHPVECCRMCGERGVTSEHFYLPAHQVAFSALMDMHRANKPVDIVTFTGWMLDRQIIQSAGGPAYISELFTYLPTATNVAHYIDILCEKLTLRKIITTCTKHAQMAYEEQEEPARALEAVEKDIMGIRVTRAVQRGFTGHDVAVIGGAMLARRCEHVGKASGLPTGFADLDRRTDGLHPGELIVLAGRPLCGKSALSANIMEFLAIGQRVACGFLSLEMGKDPLCERLVASCANVNLSRWQHGQPPTEAELKRINWAQQQYDSAPMFFEEGSDVTIQEIRGIGRRLKKDYDIKLLIVDSLSKVRSHSKQARENRAREVAEAIDGMKEMAKELGIPVLVLHHIGRDKNEEPKRPRLSDLRESGNIEQDADSVWMLWKTAEGKTELFGAKCRHGESDFTVPMNFEREFVRFTYQAAKSEQAELNIK